MERNSSKDEIVSIPMMDLKEKIALDQEYEVQLLHKQITSVGDRF
jgi:hypothetical protein